MALLLHLCVGLFFVAGLGTAIGIPLLTHSTKESKTTRNNKLEGGDIGQVTITECSTQGKREGDSIFFGSQKEGNICGTVEEGSQNIDGSEEYTSLFQERGDSKSKEGNRSENQNQGTQQCLDYSEQGFTASEQGSGIQYLGLCGNTKVDETKFVKKVQEKELINNEEKWSLGLCSNECGAPNTETFGGTPRALKEKDKENSAGKKVLFYKN